MDRNVNFRANSRYTYKTRKVSLGQPTNIELFFRVLAYFYKMAEKILLSDGFAAGFCGVALLLIIGIVGGVEFGRLSLALGVKLSVILLSAVSIIIYKKNRE